MEREREREELTAWTSPVSWLRFIYYHENYGTVKKTLLIILFRGKYLVVTSFTHLNELN